MLLSCVPALKCVCRLCENDTCETSADGACWNSVMLIDGKEETDKSCLSAEKKNQVYCYSSRNVSKRNCCFTDFCNNENLHLYQGRFLCRVSEVEMAVDFLNLKPMV